MPLPPLLPPSQFCGSGWGGWGSGLNWPLKNQLFLWICATIIIIIIINWSAISIFHYYVAMPRRGDNGIDCHFLRDFLLIFRGCLFSMFWYFLIVWQLAAVDATALSLHSCSLFFNRVLCPKFHCCVGCQISKSSIREQHVYLTTSREEP